MYSADGHSLPLIPHAQCVTQLSVTVKKYLRKTSMKWSELFWLKDSEVFVHGPLASFLLGLW
jgi:hypothetical protein